MQLAGFHMLAMDPEDGRGCDDQGRAIMQIRTMRMQWVSE